MHHLLDSTSSKAALPHLLTDRGGIGSLCRVRHPPSGRVADVQQGTRNITERCASARAPGLAPGTACTGTYRYVLVHVQGVSCLSMRAPVHCPQADDSAGLCRVLMLPGCAGV